MVVDHVIVNVIDSDIVIEFRISDGQKITIASGEVHKIPYDSYPIDFYNGNKPYMSMPTNILDRLNPEMTINEVVIPDAIWSSEYWNFDPDEVEVRTRDIAIPQYYNPTFTLIVTEELLEVV
jgi:hypothetical protein